MRVLGVIRIDEGQELGEPPAALFEAMAAFSEECVRNGQLLDEGGLAPTSQAVRVASTGGSVTLTDGPFTETKEVVGGYAMWQVRSFEEAVELGRRFMQIHADTWPELDAACEVRQVVGSPEAGD